MKKTLIFLSSMLLVIGVFASQSLAHSSGHPNKGHDNHGHDNHGNNGSNAAQLWSARLKPPAGATGSTGSTASTSNYNAYTETSGRALWVQNKKNTLFLLTASGLASKTAYTVAIYADTDGLGCASTTNTALNPPAIPGFTTNRKGSGNTLFMGKRSTFGLDPAKSYYVRVNDPGGVAALCGALILRTHGHGDDYMEHHFGH